MAIRSLDHVNIGTERLADTVAFFKEVLGLREGWRPDFPFGGAWLYVGDRAVVHLVDLPEGRRPSAEAALDHFAFEIDDYDGTLANLQRAGVTHRKLDVPGAPVRQIFVQDPNGVNIELNWRAPAGQTVSTSA